MHRVPLEEAVAAVFTGEIRNSLTVAGLLATAYARGPRVGDAAPGRQPLAGPPGSLTGSDPPRSGRTRPRLRRAGRDAATAPRPSAAEEGTGREGRHPAGSQGPRVPGGHHPGRGARARPRRAPGYVEKDAGIGSSLPDDDFVAAGATILADPDDVWDVDLVLKVKEPVAEEYNRMRSGRTLFTYLHLAASRECTQALLDSGIARVAYETVQTADGALPLLAPMSEVAGRMAPQVGAHTLERAQGGRGVLMGGVSGVYAAKVVVLGAGVSGMNAAAIALGMQAEVLLLDRNIDKLRAADRIYQGHLQTIASNAYEIEQAVLDADLVIGAVLVPGAKAPMLISDELVARMKPGSVLVDIAVDQGGCFESSRPTTHSDPTYQVASSRVLLRGQHARRGAAHLDVRADQRDHAVRAGAGEPGLRDAVRESPALLPGVNMVGGQVTNAPVAEAHGLPWVSVEQALSL